MSDSVLNILIKAQDQASRVIGSVGGAVDNLKSKAGGLAKQGFGAMNNAFQATASTATVGIPIIGGLLGAMAVKAGQAQAQVQTMGVALETAMGGNIQLAKEAQKNITDFASKTPYALEEVMTAFVKLKNMGLDPSNEALTAYGDTASAMGKSLNDMIEAVADASTGEFERLKEFGIRASKQGDNVAFTFKGVTTTVKNNSEEIEKYLIKLGQTNFSGGMEKQSKTLAGLWSTLSDTINLKLASAFEKLGGSQAVTTLFENLIKVIEGADIDGFVDSMGHLGSIIEGLIKGTDIFEDSIGSLTDTLNSLGLDVTYEQVENFIRIVQDALEPIQEFLGQAEVQQSILAGLATVIGLVLAGAFITLASSVASAIAPFVLIGLAVAGLYYAWQTNMGGIQQIWEQVSSFIMNAYTQYIQPHFKDLQDQLKVLWDSFMELYNVIQPYIMPVLMFIGAVIGGIVVGAILVLITTLKFLMSNFTTVFNYIREMIANFRNIWKGLGDFVMGVITGDWGRAFNGFKTLVKGIFDSIVSTAKAGFNLVTNPINALIDTYNRANDVFGGADIPKIPRFASGTNYAQGGLAIVGERGAEIVNLPRGASVTSTAETRGLNMGGQQNIVINTRDGYIIDWLRANASEFRKAGITVS